MSWAGWQEIDKTLDLGYIRVAGLHRECKPAVLFDPPNFRPRTMTHIKRYISTTEVAFDHPIVSSMDRWSSYRGTPMCLCIRTTCMQRPPSLGPFMDRVHCTWDSIAPEYKCPPLLSP